MDTKNPKRKIINQRFTRITPELFASVCTDYNARVSLRAIARKYSTSYETVRKIIDTREVHPDLDAPFDAQKVMERQTKDPLTRTVEVKKDAQATVEMTLALIHHKVHQDVQRVIAADPKFPPKLSIDELTRFFDKAAPYALPKIDAPKRAAHEKDAVSPIKKAHDMFKSEAQNKPKPQAEA